MTKNAPSKMKLRIEAIKRLEFIEFQLYWYGKLQRKFLIDAFQISGFQATKDIKLYLELAPKNIHYDTSDRCYYPSEKFTPQYHQPNVDQFLNGFNFGNEFSLPLSIETLSLPMQTIELSVLRELVKAIINNDCVKVRYLSLGGDSDKWRVISPQGFSNSGAYWDVRSYCHLDSTYKFFSCSRIIDIKKIKQEPAQLGSDLEWETKVELKLGIHPNLSAAQKKILEREYKAKKNIIIFPIRLAFYHHFKERFQLGGRKANPLLNPFEILNAKEIETQLKEIRKAVK